MCASASACASIQPIEKTYKSSSFLIVLPPAIRANRIKFVGSFFLSPFIVVGDILTPSVIGKILTPRVVGVILTPSVVGDILPVW